MFWRKDPNDIHNFRLCKESSLELRIIDINSRSNNVVYKNFPVNTGTMIVSVYFFLTLFTMLGLLVYFFGIPVVYVRLP